MPKNKTQFAFRYVLYKYDVSDKQDQSDIEYEILFSEIINHGFWIPDTSWLDDELNHPDFSKYKVMDELAFDQVHEIVVNIEPWVEHDQYNGDWDGGVHWHEVAHKRLTGEDLKAFLIFYPRCNRLQGTHEENTWKAEGGDGCLHSMEYELAIDSTDVPDELKKLSEEDLKIMTNYFKATFKKYALEIQ